MNSHLISLRSNPECRILLELLYPFFIEPIPGKDTAPWDWSRIKDKYTKLHTVVFESVALFGLQKTDTHKRLEIMEILQDEMMEAAKKRGTR